jgi:hypothetical protein
MGAKTGSGSKGTANDAGKSGNDSGSRVKEARGPRTCTRPLTRTVATASPTRTSRISATSETKKGRTCARQGPALLLHSGYQ